MTYSSKTIYLLCFTMFLSCTKNNQESIVSFKDGGGLTDIEGNSYPTVIIENNKFHILISNINEAQEIVGNLICRKFFKY